MASYDNNMSGILARNTRKEKDAHPDFQGSCEINGIQMWISGWIRVGKPGSKMENKKYFSLAFTPKEAAPPAQARATSTPPVATAQPAQKPIQAADDDSIPF